MIDTPFAIAYSNPESPAVAFLGFAVLVLPLVQPHAAVTRHVVQCHAQFEHRVVGSCRALGRIG
jgi:hypothetical protein